MLLVYTYSGNIFYLMAELSDSTINLNKVNEHLFLPRLERRSPKMKEEYIQAITELLKKCNDLSILDLIYQLLKKHSAQT